MQARAEAEREAAKAQKQQADTFARTTQAKKAEADQKVEELTAQVTDLQKQLADEKARADGAENQNTTLTSKSFVAALPKPSAFHGLRAKDKVTVSEWLDTVRDYLYSSKIATVDVQKVQFAEGLLQGDARRAWKSAKTSLRQPIDSDDPYAGITFHVFAQHLEQRWNPTCSTVDARYRLDALKQAGSSMPKFISKFDDLCTHFPTMDLGDKIHRFLTKLDPEYSLALAVDPATRQRWDSFDKLKVYATNYAASLVSNAALRKRPAAARPGALTSIAEKVGRTLGADAGWETPRPRKQQRGSSSGSGPSSPAAAAAAAGPNRPSQFMNFRNANKEPFTRHTSLIRWCHGKSICLCCYAHYDSSTVHLHRERCKQPPKPDNTFPDGYKIGR
jgi:hypothetical protein